MSVPSGPASVPSRRASRRRPAGLLARIEAMTGREEKAIERLEYLLSVPSDVSVWWLRLDPAWDALRGNPRFEALVAEG